MNNTTDSRESVLAVDDSPETLEVIQRILGANGYDVLLASGVPEAIGILDQTPVDIVITDLKMPRIGGMKLVRHVRENFRDTEVLMITGYPTVESAIEAVKTGAEDYLSKPFTDDELIAAVGRTVEKLRLRRAGHDAVSPAAVAPSGLLGESEAMRKLLHTIDKAASTSATVLITGESGTGKELVARAIQYRSAPAAAPFVPINCGGIPEGLIESELFGHVKGAFTGATESHAGFFQTADGGTIFLDEISEISLSLQVKLLRVLQDKEVFMVGSGRPRKVDVRITAATNKDLLTLVKKNLFREDLFFRLNVITIEVPPLRDREDDPILLARHFATRFSGEIERTPPTFTDATLRVLKDYPWPGNVRELENLVQRLVVMSESDTIDVPDLPVLMRYSISRSAGVHHTLAEVEREHVRLVLASVKGNESQAARILGIDRKTLRSKLTVAES